MKFSHPLSHYRAEIETTLARFRECFKEEDAYCRFILTRGVGKIGFSRASVTTPTQLVIIVQPLRVFGKPDWEKGLNIHLSPTRLRNPVQALDPAMKSGNYLNSLLATLEAQDLGHDDAVLCDFDGHVTEGTTFNVFYVKRGIVVTPPTDIGILHGITRLHIFAILRKLGIEYREVRFPKERFLEADEVFVSGTVKEVFPVTQVDGNPIGSPNGRPGIVTRRIHEAFREHVEAACVRGTA